MQEYHQLKADIEALSREVQLAEGDSDAMQSNVAVGEDGRVVGVNRETHEHGIGN